MSATKFPSICTCNKHLQNKISKKSVAQLINIYLKKHNNTCEVTFSQSLLNDLNSYKAYKKKNISIEEVIYKYPKNGEFSIHSHKHPHQRRISENTLKQLAKDLRKIKGKSIKDFEKIYAEISSHAKAYKGIGFTTIYDYALRLGWVYSLKPKKVYIHSGVYTGAKYLGLLATEHKKNCKCSLKYGGYISIECLPAAFNKMEPYQIEDFLCVMKDRFVKEF